MSNASRAANFKARQAAAGLAQFMDWLPPSVFADLHECCQRIREDRKLSFRLYNTETGRVVARSGAQAKR